MQSHIQENHYQSLPLDTCLYRYQRYGLFSRGSLFISPVRRLSDSEPPSGFGALLPRSFGEGVNLVALTSAQVTDYCRAPQQVLSEVVLSGSGM